MSEPSQAVRDFVAGVELREIDHYELSAVRGLPGSDGIRPVIGPGRLDEGSGGDDVDNELNVFWTGDRAQVLVRLHSTLRSDAGEIRVGTQAEYTVAEDVRGASVEVEWEFVNRVAIMAIVPYTRAAVAELSSRVFGVTYTLSVIRPGDITFAPQERAAGQIEADSE